MHNLAFGEIHDDVLKRRLEDCDVELRLHIVVQSTRIPEVLDTLDSGYCINYNDIEETLQKVREKLQWLGNRTDAENWYTQFKRYLKKYDDRECC